MKINHALYTQLKQLNTEFVKQKHLINIQEASGGWKNWYNNDNNKAKMQTFCVSSSLSGSSIQ